MGSSATNAEILYLLVCMRYVLCLKIYHRYIRIFNVQYIHLDTYVKTKKNQVKTWRSRLTFYLNVDALVFSRFSSLHLLLFVLFRCVVQADL